LKERGICAIEQASIKPYHLFNYEERTYLINTEEMTAAIIDETAARALEKIRMQPTPMLGHGIAEELKKLGLLSDGKETTPAMKKEYLIVNLCLFLTQSCNLNCVYCYGDAGAYGAGGNMDEKTAYQGVDWLIEQSGKKKQIYVGFFGGEPFLMFSLMKAIVQYARKRVAEVGKIVSFYATSNGTLFDDEVINFIKEEEISIIVSFDGPREIQDAQRPYANGDGSYDAIVPKIKKLLAVVPKTPSHAVIVGDTDPKLVEDALQEIGFTEFSLVPASHSLFTDNLIREGQTRDTLQLIQELEKQVKIWLDSIRRRDVLALKRLASKRDLYQAMLSLLHNIKKQHACGAGLGMVAVSSVGDVYLCHRFVGQDDYKLGSIFEGQLNRKKYQENSTINNPLCSVCFAKHYCAGGCKHDNAGSCGSIAAPAEEMCRLRCRKLELAAIIVSNLTSQDKAFLIEQDVFPPKPCPLDF
jgi:uncharacterized protein